MAAESGYLVTPVEKRDSSCKVARVQAGAVASAPGGALINVTSPPLAAVQAARAHTLAAASARIELTIDRNWEMPSGAHQRRGGLLRPLLRASKWTARKLLKAAAPDLDFRHQTAEGVIDLTGRRYMLDYGHFAVLHADGQEWGGRSGRAIATLPSDPEAVPTPLWLVCDRCRHDPFRIEIRCIPGLRNPGASFCIQVAPSLSSSSEFCPRTVVAEVPRGVSPGAHGWPAGDHPSGRWAALFGQK